MFDTTLDTTTDETGNKYDLRFEVKDSDIPEVVDIRFYSRLSSSKTGSGKVLYEFSVPLEGVDEISDTLIDYLRTKTMEKL